MPGPSLLARARRKASLIRDLHWSREHASLRALRGRHRGERAFLIGNGPSVREADLERLRGEVTFCFNRFHLAYERLEFRPSYTMLLDDDMIADFGREIVRRSAGEVIVASHVHPGDLGGPYAWTRNLRSEPFRFSARADRRIHCGGSVVVGALQVAYFMGIRDVVLYGVDHQFSYRRVEGRPELAVGEGNHFIPGYRSGRPWRVPETRRIEAALDVCRIFFEAEGGRVRNATRGGRLETFDRVDFDAAVDDPGKPGRAALGSAGREGR